MTTAVSWSSRARGWWHPRGVWAHPAGVASRSPRRCATRTSHPDPTAWSQRLPAGTHRPARSASSCAAGSGRPKSSTARRPDTPIRCLPCRRWNSPTLPASTSNTRRSRTATEAIRPDQVSLGASDQPRAVEGGAGISFSCWSRAMVTPKIAQRLEQILPPDHLGLQRIDLEPSDPLPCPGQPDNARPPFCRLEASRSSSSCSSRSAHSSDPTASGHPAAAETTPGLGRTT